MSKIRQWRVDAIHTAGYHAPHLLIETESDRRCDSEVEALSSAKQISRFADFKDWKFKVTLLDRKKLNGKWYPTQEYLRRIGR